MPSSRTIAARVLTSVLKDHQSLNQALSQVKINNVDRGFVQELCYGVLRWYWQLEGIVKQLLKNPLKENDTDIQALLLIGLYQLIHLQTPEHAALHETVQAARELKKSWATKLINGVLRNFLRQGDKISEKINRDLSAHYSHPKWLIKLIQQAWFNDWEEILDANNQRPPMILRVNRLQNSREEYLELLNVVFQNSNDSENESVEAQRVSNSAKPLTQSTQGIILKIPCDVKLLPGFAEGKVSVQDGAAQFAAELLDLKSGQRVLDACAAPGGKTAHILETEPKLAELISLDVDPDRCKKIRENVQRLGLGEGVIKILTADALKPKSWWDGKPFDRILLDAPCSSTGVIRRHPDIKYLRRATDIATLAKTQLEMLETLWPLLKPNGLLVYATCSVLPQENSEVLQKFLKTHSDATEKPITADWGRPMQHGYQILPGENGMDGFYYACLLKSFKI